MRNFRKVEWLSGCQRDPTNHSFLLVVCDRAWCTYVSSPEDCLTIFHATLSYVSSGTIVPSSLQQDSHQGYNTTHGIGNKIFQLVKHWALSKKDNMVLKGNMTTSRNMSSGFKDTFKMVGRHGVIPTKSVRLQIW
jgi:hypothetical protein